MRVLDQDVKFKGRLVRIVRFDSDAYEPVDDPEGAIAAMRKSGADLFTFMQILPETTRKFSYPMEWDNVAALPITTFDHWFTKQIDGKTRNMVRRAEKKGIVLREVPFDDNLVRGIWEIYNECPVRQGRPFPHYGEDLETVRNISATFPDTSVFIGAFAGEQLAGFAKITHDRNRNQAGIMHIVSRVEHRDKAPTNALIAQCVRSCSDRGIQNLVYSNFAYGKKQQDSLSDFKVNNGFQRVDIPRYYVPLTALGRLALGAGLHQNLRDRLPESVLEQLRKWKMAWYKRKYEAVAERS